MSVELKTKPTWRGVSHQIAFFVAIAAGAGLIAFARGPLAVAATGVYAVTLAALFGVSALYHRVDWDEKKRLFMKRLDHSTIFVFIAGSYTPLCLVALGGTTGRTLLALAWAGAGLGVAQSILWPKAPKALKASLYVALGWLSTAYMPSIAQAVGMPVVAALVAGGLLYSVGAAVYATQRPDPLPAVFGYHEVFHALVIAACACHFAAIAHLVTA